MTLLRRAPREVYRVYGEQEFFAGPDRERHHIEGALSASSERRTWRSVGARTLLAVLGAAGGLIVLSGLASPGPGRRRASSGRAARTASPLFPGRAHAQLWRERASATARRPTHGRRQSARPASTARRTTAASGLLAVAPRPPSAPVVAARSQRAPVETPPAPVARLTAGASLPRRQSGRPEFGFER